MDTEKAIEEINKLIKQAQEKEEDALSDGTSDSDFWNGYWSALVKAKKIIEGE